MDGLDSILNGRFVKKDRVWYFGHGRSTGGFWFCSLTKLPSHNSQGIDIYILIFSPACPVYLTKVYYLSLTSKSIVWLFEVVRVQVCRAQLYGKFLSQTEIVFLMNLKFGTDQFVP